MLLIIVATNEGQKVSEMILELPTIESLSEVSSAAMAAARDAYQEILEEKAWNEVKQDIKNKNEVLNN